MTTPALIWIVIYGIASLLFFGAAVVITVVGSKDLKDLLSRSAKNESKGDSK